MALELADHIKLTRELDKHQSSLVRNARNRMQLSFVSTARTLSDRPVTVVLAERIPVSENTDIRVSNGRILPNEKPDPRGIVRWGVTLAPREARELRVSYQVDYPPSLVLDVRRKKMQTPASPSPATAPKMDFEERLIQIEKQF